ncbi:MAG: hypothetical protein FVQ83_11005 [Chloroflexi bacterium]|nr:hypothetical protein [Chloroflexota bacterium]
MLAACGQTSIDQIPTVITQTPRPTSTQPIPTRTSVPSPTLDYSETRWSNTQTAIALTGTALQQITHIPIRTPLPAVTKYPTMGSSPTSRPVLPLIEHEWVPEPVLVERGYNDGDGGISIDYPPYLRLYGDGMLVMSIYREEFGYRPMYKNLARGEVCRLLNSIDQTGFLNYDPRIYQSPFDGGGENYIKVESWRSNYISHTELAGFINGMWYEFFEELGRIEDSPVILPALKDTYRLLANYEPDGMRSYYPQNMIVWLLEAYTDDPGEPWPLSSISLNELLEQRNSDYEEIPIIIGDPNIGEWFNQIDNGIYYQGNLRLDIYARPMWPYEILGESGTLLPDPNAELPTDPISCYPSDGVLPIPTE